MPEEEVPPRRLCGVLPFFLHRGCVAGQVVASVPELTVLMDEGVPEKLAQAPTMAFLDAR